MEKVNPIGKVVVMVTINPMIGVRQVEQGLQTAIVTEEFGEISRYKMTEIEDGTEYKLMLAQLRDVENLPLDNAIGGDPLSAETCRLLYMEQGKCSSNGNKASCEFRRNSLVKSESYIKAMSADLNQHFNHSIARIDDYTFMNYPDGRYIDRFGMIYTSDQVREYQSTLRPGSPEAKHARTFEQAFEQTYGHGQAYADETRDYSDINSEYGWGENAWIPKGRVQAVYIGAHGAFFKRDPYDHVCIVIFVTRGSRYFRSNSTGSFRNFPQKFGSCQVQFTTIGGSASFTQEHLSPVHDTHLPHASAGHVVCLFDSKTDVDMLRKEAMLPIDSSDGTIQKLLEKSEIFQQNQSKCKLTYVASPNKWSKYQYNSGSFLKGLLESANVNNLPNISNNDAPGWGYPIPRVHFENKCTLDCSGSMSRKPRCYSSKY